MVEQALCSRRADQASVLAIDMTQRQGAVIQSIDTARIDAEYLGITATSVVYIDPARTTKVMLGHAAVPAIQTQRIFATADAKMLPRHRGHQRIALAAQRTVATDQFFNFGFKREANRSAVTGARVVHRGYVSIVSELAVSS